MRRVSLLAAAVFAVLLSGGPARAWFHRHRGYPAMSPYVQSQAAIPPAQLAGLILGGLGQIGQIIHQVHPAAPPPTRTTPSRPATVPAAVRDQINKNDDALTKLVEQTNKIDNAKFKDKKIQSHSTGSGRSGSRKDEIEDPNVGD